MDFSSDFGSLRTTETPVLIADGAGVLQAANEAAQHLLTECAARPMSAGCLTLRDVLLPAESEQILEARGPTTVRITLQPRGAPAQCALFDECLVVPLSLNTSPRSFLLAFQRNAQEVLPIFAREEFLATVAHDLKNPLGAIFSYADALLDTSLGTGLDDRQRQILTRVRRTALRSIDLVRNYQQLSQLRAGILPVPASPTDLNSVVATVLEYCWRPDVSSPRLHLALSPCPVEVPVERLPLERVISNLFSNALKFTPPDGRITVSTERLEGGGSRLSVSNTGPGIAPEERETIFLRFKRGTAAAGTTGSGLGLYIVKTILDAVGGSITISSLPDDTGPSGVTTFTVTLP